MYDTGTMEEQEHDLQPETQQLSATRRRLLTFFVLSALASYTAALLVSLTR